MSRPITKWAIRRGSRNSLDGERSFLVCGAAGLPILFATRAEARAYIARQFGYFKNRPDLRAEPHGWHTPRAVRVSVTVTEV